PGLAETLGRRPGLLDAMLVQPPGAITSARLAEDLEAMLALAGDLQDVLDLVRRFAGDHGFRIGVAMLRGRMQTEQATAELSDIADCVIRGLLPRIAENFAQAHGLVPGGAFAVLALGKLGSRELTPASDLDLVFVYDSDGAVESSDGAKTLPVSVYYQ